MLSRPLVTVFIPVRDEPRLHYAVSSILAQSLTDLELLVMDNSVVPDPYLKQLGGIPRVHVHYIEPSDRGPSGAINAAIFEHARGQYIARQDADDVSAPTRLRKQVEFLRETGLDACSCQFDYLSCCAPHPGRWDLPVEWPVIRRRLRRGNCLGGGYWMATREILLRAGPQAWVYPWLDDWEHWILMVQAGAKIGVVDEVLYHICWHEKPERARIVRENTELVRTHFREGRFW